jgi:hypothetical protein
MGHKLPAAVLKQNSNMNRSVLKGNLGRMLDYTENIGRKIKYPREEMIETWSTASSGNAEEILNYEAFLKQNLVSFGDHMKVDKEIKEESKMTSNGDTVPLFITHLFHLAGSTQGACGRQYLKDAQDVTDQVEKDIPCKDICMGT